MRTSFMRQVDYREKMPQSGVGSMQGSNEDYLPMKEHTQGGGHTHNVTQRTDTQIFLTNVTDKTDGQSHILRQHAA